MNSKQHPKKMRVLKFFVITTSCLTGFGMTNQALAVGSPGDVTGDGVVNINDLMIITANFGRTTNDSDLDTRADTNGDGVINNTDLSITISAFAQEGDTNLTLSVDKENVTVGETVTVTVELAEAAQFASWQTWLNFGNENNVLALEQQNEGTFTTFVPDSRSLVSINASSEIRAGGFNLANNKGGSGTLGTFTFKAMSSSIANTAIPSKVNIYTENKSDQNSFGTMFNDITGFDFVPTLAVRSVTVNVWPQNTPPVVSAGDDKTIRLPNSVTLIGSVSDDGLPDSPGTVTTQWDKTSGPGAVTFSTPTQTTTTASFSKAGTYKIQLTGNDESLSADDEIKITVKHTPKEYFVTPDRTYTEIGETTTIPITIHSNNIDVGNLLFDFVTSSLEVFSNALFI